MKKLLLLFTASLFMIASSLNSQVLYSDDFESYTVGQGIALQEGNWWDTWEGNPGSDEDPLVSDAYALSGTQSIQVYGNNDGVIDFGGITEGRYRVEFYILIPEGRQGYYNIMQNFNSAGNNLIWGLQVFFQDGVCTIDGNGASSASFDYTEGEWMKFQHFIDLNSDWIDMYVDDQLILAYQWSNGVFGAGYQGINQLGAFDFYAWNEGGICEYYMDDFLIEEVDTPYPPTDFNSEIINGNDVLLTWDAPEDGTPESYSVVRDGEEIAIVDDATTYTDENLYPNTYTYQLYAFYGSSSGYSSSAGIEEVTIPGGNEREFVLFELFTGTWCAFCPTATQAAAMLENDNLDVAIIKYHGGDGYETPATAARTDFYVPFFADPGETSFGYPANFINGMEGFTGAAPTAQEHFEIFEYYYEEYIEIPTVHNLNATVEPDFKNTGDYQLNITITETFPYFEDEIRLMVALTEKDIPENWEGETHVTNVLREMYPNANGTVMDFSSETTIEETFNVSITNDYVPENCEVIIFLQNMNTGHVIATTKLDVIPDLTNIATAENNKISVFPNPANDLVEISSNNTISSVKIMNNTGQVIDYIEVNKDRTNVSLTNYSAGIYFIQIQSEKKSHVEKLIVK